MRALTPEQRKAHLQRTTKPKTPAKPKPGQKGAGSTVRGAKTKAGTIGGGNVNTPKPTATTKPKPTASNKSKPIGDGKGGVSKPNGRTGKPTPQPKPRASNPATDGRYIPGNQQVQFRVAPPPVAPARSPAASAPIHASPRAFGSVQKLQQPSTSPYVGSSAATPARPSTPGQAVQQQAAQPQQQPFFEQVVPQQQPQQQPFFEQVVPQQRPAAAQPQPSPVGPVSDGGDYGHMVQATRPQQAPVDENGFDMERRRAFLDADNSLNGMKAVRELLNRRKLSISVEN